MIELAYIDDTAPTVLAPHNAIDFEFCSPSFDTFAAFSYGSDYDWTKAISRGGSNVISKRPTPADIDTPDTLTNDFNDHCHDIPADNGFASDQGDQQNEISDAFTFDRPQGEAIFPGLPPLYRGRPDVHLRNGILNARELAAAGEPDAEKAFFVGDLSDVYRQHKRWMRCLPEIQPFYGTFTIRGSTSRLINAT